MVFGKLDYEYIWKKSMVESYGLKVNSVEVLFGFVYWEDVLSRFLDIFEKIDFEVSCRRLLDLIGMYSSLFSFFMLFLLCCVGCIVFFLFCLFEMVF